MIYSNTSLLQSCVPSLIELAALRTTPLGEDWIASVRILQWEHIVWLVHMLVWSWLLCSLPPILRNGWPAMLRVCCNRWLISFRVWVRCRIASVPRKLVFLHPGHRATLLQIFWDILHTNQRLLALAVKEPSSIHTRACCLTTALHLTTPSSFEHLHHLSSLKASLLSVHSSGHFNMCRGGEGWIFKERLFAIWSLVFLRSFTFYFLVVKLGYHRVNWVIIKFKSGSVYFFCDIIQLLFAFDFQWLLNFWFDWGA